VAKDKVYSARNTWDPKAKQRAQIIEALGQSSPAAVKAKKKILRALEVMMREMENELVLPEKGPAKLAGLRP